MSLVDTGVRAPTRPPAVTVLAWPAEADRAALLKAVGQARLLLVAADADPPEERDDMTDWVRLPVSHRDVMARVDALGRRGRPAPPWGDDDDVLRLGHRWAAL